MTSGGIHFVGESVLLKTDGNGSPSGLIPGHAGGRIGAVPGISDSG